MINLIFYSFLSFFNIFIYGYFFNKFFINRSQVLKKNIFEYGIFGIIFISFIALLLNYFIPLGKEISSLVFFIPIIFFIIFFYRKKIFRDFVLFSFLSSLVFFIIIAYDNTYRPDAGSYHLPFISILNEDKIIFGLNNIHYRLGHVSIMQYISAIYNNYLFGDLGVVIPLGLLQVSMIGYFYYNIFFLKNNNSSYIFSILILAFILIFTNRYSELGNDAPAHYYFFFIISKFLEEKTLEIKIKELLVISVFILLNKLTMILSIIIPFYFFLRYCKFKQIINLASLFSIFFLIIFLGKNIINSGCIIFPVKESCFKFFVWYDYNSNRQSNAEIANFETEAWAKGWNDQNGEKKDFKEYVSDFSWIKTWAPNHGKIILIKLKFYIVFLIIFIIYIIIFTKNNYDKNNKTQFSKDLKFLFFLVLTGSTIWFLKSPTFRYGYGYIIVLISLIIVYFINIKIQLDLKKFNLIIFILIAFLVVGKHTNRIIKNYDTRLPIFPRIYSDNLDQYKRKNIPIYKNNRLMYYKSELPMCYYSQSPCTHMHEDIGLKNLNLKIIKGYKIYFFDR